MPVKQGIVLPPGITLEIGRIETFRFVTSPPLDQQGQRGWIRNPWTVGPPILNEAWMKV
jgi:hypothetical protein